MFAKVLMEGDTWVHECRSAHLRMRDGTSCLIFDDGASFDLAPGYEVYLMTETGQTFDSFRDSAKTTNRRK